MSGFLLHVGATGQCTHGGPVTVVPSQARVVVGGQPVATTGSQLLVAGCAFNVSGKPQPCVTVQWLVPSTRFIVGGQPALLQLGPGTGAGICQSVEQIPQGPPIVAAMQTRVMGT